MRRRGHSASGSARYGESACSDHHSTSAVKHVQYGYFFMIRQLIALVSVLALSSNTLGDDPSQDPAFRREVLDTARSLGSYGDQKEAAKHYFYGISTWTDPSMREDLVAACDGLFAIYYMYGLHEKQEEKLANCPKEFMDEAYGRVDRPYRPMRKVAPLIPRAAWRRSRSGHVIVKYTVLKDGKVGDVEILESSSPMFEKPSIKAAKQFLYLPAVIGGEPVETEGVTNKFTFNVPPLMD